MDKGKILSSFSKIQLKSNRNPLKLSKSARFSNSSKSNFPNAAFYSNFVKSGSGFLNLLPNNLSQSSKCFYSTSSEGDVYQFKAETQKLLQIVAHSLYTDKEVFVRELISNASDALEKLRFLESTREGLAASKVDPDVGYKIRISVDPKTKTFTIEDTGVGMTKEEIVNNLGTIAKSGSLEFLNDPNLNAKDKANAIIGQFGVGFYSSFVVSDRVEVFTRSYDPEKDPKGYHWVSDGTGSFTLKEVDNLPRGTKIICYLKDDSLLFCNSNNVKKVAEKFSSFINFPLFLQEKDKDVEITTQKPLWVEKKSSPEEHTKFYRFLCNTSWGEPMYTLNFHSDSPLSIKSLFYIPEDAPNRMFQASNELGVSLYSRYLKVLIKKSAENIIPKWLFFVKGVIDCEDMPLNVSRENMQDNQLMAKLSNTVVTKLLKFLQQQSKSDVDKYMKFYNKYNYYLKEGAMDEYYKNGKHKDLLLSLLRYESTMDEGLTTLDDYVSNMSPDQKNIYYFCTTNRQMALNSPYMETFKSKNVNVLLMYDEIDQFLSMNIQEYKDKKFVSIDSPEDDFELENKTEPSESEKSAESSDSEHKLEEKDKETLINFFKNNLGSKVNSVKFSDRLVDSPAMITGFLSPALRKVMKATMKGSGEDPLANLPCTLELNPNHKTNLKILQLVTKNPEVAKVLVNQLYDNASIAAGVVDDPRVMLSRLNQLLELTADYACNQDNNQTN
ncbi:Hsp90 family protein [Theileria parva strain Muguga]|uniref:Heat shock protein 75, putative n=1 Tax=Theileria parva TaxID=5875 RepID=Q4N7R7_THEPA|nr:Hsp90 family protein [Theileria parva strain Muguga]EAN33991.1 Hsp90 family protein [Theileria parva strain Muguga]|eukprot:XP_766274.1 heat shock protein 75 [Theileria parva strain Muguga]